MKDELKKAIKEAKEVKEFWDEIILNKDGTINIEQVYKELSDFKFVMEQVPKVYCHITGGALGKLMYDAQTVITLADDIINRDYVIKDDLRDFLE